jgi:hypothetical protein
MGVPLDLQRKCEQRWAARFARPAPSAAPKGHQPESQNQQLATPAGAKKETGPTEAAGLGAATASEAWRGRATYSEAYCSSSGVRASP